MHRLQSTILEYSQVLLSVMEHCAELDWYCPVYSPLLAITTPIQSDSIILTGQGKQLL